MQYERQLITLLDGSTSITESQVAKLPGNWLSLERVVEIQFGVIARSGATGLFSGASLEVRFDDQSPTITLASGTDDQQTRLSTDLDDLKLDLTNGRTGYVVAWAAIARNIARYRPESAYTQCRLVLTRDTTVVSLKPYIYAMVTRSVVNAGRAFDDRTSKASIA